MHGADVKVDNPLGDWLESERRRAMKGYDPLKKGSAARGFTGSLTARISGIHLSVPKLRDVPGLSDEHLFRDDLQGSTKLPPILESIDRGEAINSPAELWVNHLGKTYISEGNHRVAAANMKGLGTVPVTIKYFNGGELAEGLFSPKALFSLYSIGLMWIG